MKKIGLAQRAIALPLLGLVFTWGFTMVSIWVGMIGRENYDKVEKPSIYILLAGFAVAGISSLIAHDWAAKSYRHDETDLLSRAAVRFTSLTVVLSLAVLTIFAFGSFMSAFGNSLRFDVVARLLWVYLPIILAIGLIVFIVLRAYVFRRGERIVIDGEKTRMSETQKALALGYAIPILAAAVAIILGLAIYDATRTNLQVWVWVLIIAIVGLGIVFGTHFAAKARSAKPAVARPRAAWAAGAASLNFVLSVVFGGVVSIMAFVYGSESFSKLQSWPMITDPKFTGPYYPDIKNPDLAWYINDLAPAKVLLLLAVVGVYVSITERNKKVAAE